MNIKSDNLNSNVYEINKNLYYSSSSTVKNYWRKAIISNNIDNVLAIKLILLFINYLMRTIIVY
jgi:hypothetical protein